MSDPSLQPLWETCKESRQAKAPNPICKLQVAQLSGTLAQRSALITFQVHNV